MPPNLSICDQCLLVRHIAKGEAAHMYNFLSYITEMCPDLGVGPWFSTLMNSHSALAGSTRYVWINSEKTSNQNHLHSFTLNAHKSFRYFRWKWPPKIYMTPSSETHVECPALSVGSLPFVRTLDHWRVSRKTRVSAVKKKSVMRNVNIYLYARRKSKDPKSRCRGLARHRTLEKTQWIPWPVQAAAHCLFLRNTKEPMEEIVVKLLRDGTSPDVANELADMLSTLVQDRLIWHCIRSTLLSIYLCQWETCSSWYFPCECRHRRECAGCQGQLHCVQISAKHDGYHSIYAVTKDRWISRCCSRFS